MDWIRLDWIDYVVVNVLGAGHANRLFLPRRELDNV
jgi:hypothetical protein